jgi:hypothetical protein
VSICKLYPQTSVPWKMVKDLKDPLALLSQGLDAGDGCDIVSVGKKRSKDGQRPLKRRIRSLTTGAPEAEFSALVSAGEGVSVNDLMSASMKMDASVLEKICAPSSAAKPRAADVVEQRVTRKASYVAKSKDLEKWTQAIKVNRNAETLDLRDPSRRVNLSSAAMVSKFAPTSDMEKEIRRLLEGKGEAEVAASEEAELERSGLTVEQVSCIPPLADHCAS